MILGVGIDAVEIERIKNLLEKFEKKFEEKIFSKNEIEIAKKFNQNLSAKSKHYAKRFAAKEAFSKATGLGIGRGINFIDIEIVSDENGKPQISLSQKAELFLKQHFSVINFKIDVSLTDESRTAGSIVIISKA